MTDEGAGADATAREAVLAHARRGGGSGAAVTLGDALRAAAEVRAAVDDHLRTLVDWARTEGATWAEIGAAIGVTAQAAQQRYGRSVKIN
jgi:hypothetical protein